MAYLQSLFYTDKFLHASPVRRIDFRIIGVLVGINVFSVLLMAFLSHAWLSEVRAKISEIFAFGTGSALGGLLIIFLMTVLLVLVGCGITKLILMALKKDLPFARIFNIYIYALTGQKLIMLGLMLAFLAFLAMFRYSGEQSIFLSSGQLTGFVKDGAFAGLGNLLSMFVFLFVYVSALAKALRIKH